MKAGIGLAMILLGAALLLVIFTDAQLFTSTTTSTSAAQPAVVPLTTNSQLQTITL